MPARKTDGARLARYAAEHARLAAQLAGIGFIWPGTIQRRVLRCGKAGCACRTDPKARHGPYPYWTSKKAQKTVSRLLSAEEAAVYEEWIENRRALERIVKQMKRLSRKAAKPALRLQGQRQDATATGA